MKVSSFAAFFMAIVAVSGNPYEYCCCYKKNADTCDVDSTKAVVTKATNDFKLVWQIFDGTWGVYDGAPWRQKDVWVWEQDTRSASQLKNKANDGLIGVKEFSEYCDKFGKVGNGAKCWNPLRDPDFPPCPKGTARSREKDDRTCRTEYYRARGGSPGGVPGDPRGGPPGGFPGGPPHKPPRR
ncbi:hypothetical protein FKW77_005744 [Venturia effusa]|uniref:Uncharacterized protein n=1 Tax=Venturia effusa TaxID=50376 RepID=A0A517LP50_9PEZI|nr:hypothetical protein FKW77_005744 [Venturia effusa]